MAKTPTTATAEKPVSTDKNPVSTLEKPLTSATAPVSVRPGTEIIEMPNSNLCVRMGQDHTLILRRDKDGTIKKAAYATVRLSKAQGEIAAIGFGDKVTWMICESGYVKLNSVLGLDCKPATDAAGISPNPYLVKDAQGNVSGVYVCYEVTGPDMKGSIVTVRQTFFFNVRQYLVEALVGAAFDKVKKDGTVYQRALEGFTFMTLADYLADPIPGTQYVPIDEREVLVIQRYISGTTTPTPAFKKYLETTIKLCKEADRRASTICRRLAFSRHPAIARTKPESVQNEVANVNLIVWMVDEEAPKVEQEYNDDAGTLGEAAFDETAITAPEAMTVDPATGEFLGDSLFGEEVV